MRKTAFVISALVLATLAASVAGQSTWKQPPKNVVDILDAPPTPRMLVSPDGTRALLITYDPYPPLEMLARPFLRLAGHRIDPALNSRQRTVRNRGIEVLDFEPVARRVVELPKDAAINSVRWSPDGTQFAFTNDVKDGVELWVGDPSTGKAAPIPGIRVNDILSAPFSWNAANGLLLVRSVPSGRGKAPDPGPVPEGPVVEETSGKVSKMMTFQDLLRNQAEEALFEYYATSQLVMVETSHGAAKPIGKPAIYTSVEASPDDKHLLVTHLKRPFSYRVPSARFAQTTEIWKQPGSVERVIADLPIADEIPPQGVPTGPRAIQWQPLTGATLVWAEALDGGDPLKKVPHRDRIMTLAAPSEAEPREIMKVKQRYSGLEWTARPNEAFVAEFDRDRRWTTTALVDLAAPDGARIVVDRSINDAYHDPGAPVQEERPDGTQVMVQDGDWVYLAGAGASEGGDRPFLDRCNLKTLQKERLWQSGENGYESFSHFVGASRTRILVRSESRTDRQTTSSSICPAASGRSSPTSRTRLPS